jgi:hypothetical protein
VEGHVVEPRVEEQRRRAADYPVPLPQVWEGPPPWALREFDKLLPVEPLLLPLAPVTTRHRPGPIQVVLFLHLVDIMLAVVFKSVLFYVRYARVQDAPIVEGAPVDSTGTSRSTMRRYLGATKRLCISPY